MTSERTAAFVMSEDNTRPTLRDILDRIEPEQAVSDSDDPQDRAITDPGEDGQIRFDSLPIQDTAHKKDADIKARSFRYSSQPGAGDFQSGAKARFCDNIAAIKALNEIERRQGDASAQEQEVLSKYAGWGGIPEAFDINNQKWKKEYDELREFLSDADYCAARASTTTSFYTPLPVIRAMYAALERFGLPGDARILEPSVGTGRFFGALPPVFETAALHGVEVDGVSARIAGILYPNATIRRGGFEASQFSDNQFDAAIGNVPFGDYQLADARYDKHHFLIHDFFFAKSLDKVRPGGIVAFITSTGTMDKEDSTVREYLARRAELIGAIRLPSDTFKTTGTDVSADIIFLQKRELLLEPDAAPPAWVETGENNDGIVVNRYYIEHPEMMLGKMKMISGRFGATSACIADSDTEFGYRLSQAVQRLEAAIPEYTHDVLDAALPAPPEVKNFTYTSLDGRVYYREHGLLIPQELNAAAKGRISAMDEIRKTARRLIDLQPAVGSEAELAVLREQLGRQYDGFAERYGYLHDRVNERLFSRDSDALFLKALEIRQDDGGYSKADIFYRRTVDPRKDLSHADSARDAVYMSLDLHGKVDLNTVMRLYPKTLDEILSELGDSVYQNPADWDDDVLKGWETREEYLSGNVRKKMKEAADAAARHPDRFSRNVATLMDSQPEWIEAGQIEVRLGASWVGKDYFNQFMWETFNTPSWLQSGRTSGGIKIEYNHHNSQWSVQNKSSDSGIKVREVYGTGRVNAYSILEDTLNLRDVTVRDKLDNDRYVVNQKETQLARAKQTQIKNAFRAWIFADSTRRGTLVDKYNHLFNSVRHRSYNGSHLTLPGLSSFLRPYTHQRNAVARICDSNQHTLLDHVVGAGKTATMIIGSYERIRLGISKRAMFVVPNHITGQFGDDIYRLYPNARAMVVTEKDFEKSKRQQFLSRISFSDVDMIVIGHSQFEKIRMSDEYQINMLEKEISEMTASIELMKKESGSRWTVKDMERSRISLETNLKRLQNDRAKDSVVTFEQLGVDILNVDEADVFKNCYIFSKLRNVAGVGTSASQRAADMLMKSRYLNESGGKLVFATGTPISNALSEMYVMQRYLQENTLQEQGIYHFDEWVSDYAETTTSLELAPEGTGFRQRTRLSKYFNLPELMQLYRQVADVQTADMLDIPRPGMRGGEPEIVLCRPSGDLLNWVQSGVERCRSIRSRSVPPEEDNMLKFTMEAKLAGLDMRLVNPEAAFDPNGKIAMCAGKIMDIYHGTQAEKGVQLVFCDSSTPSPGRFNAYAELKRILVDGGVPADKVAFIHDAKTDKAKEDLFEKCRTGDIRVLIGSTGKCGAGTNIQTRMAALHHLDCPYRPRDIEQREGRIIRNGNMFSEVSIFRYVTERSFDAYLWNIVATKQRFISQVRQGGSGQRCFEDKDETLLSFETVQAVASGNPLIMEKITLDNRISQLQLLLSEYRSQRYRLQDQIEIQIPTQKVQLEQELQRLAADRSAASAHIANGFTMVVGKSIYTKRDDAGLALIEMARSITQRGEALAVGEYMGFRMEMLRDRFSGSVFVRLNGAGVYTAELNEASSSGTCARIDNIIKDFPDKIERTQAKYEQLERSLISAGEELQKPFEFLDELDIGIQRQAELNIQLNLEDKPEEAITEENEQDPDAETQLARFSDNEIEQECELSIMY